MAVIGTFTKSENGYAGTIRTLTINAKVKLVPASDRTHEKAPHFRIFSGAVELGAAWTKTARNGEERQYLSLKLDDPSLPGAIFANLVEMDGKHRLIWNRG